MSDAIVTRPSALPPTNQEKLSIVKRPLHQIPEEERKAIACSVLDRYIQGEQVANFAHEYKASDVTIYALLLREHPEAWREIQTARALARLEKAQDELDSADDGLSLARSRERVRSAQWELERLLKRFYGEEKAQINVQGDGIKIELVSFMDSKPLDVVVEPEMKLPHVK